MENEQKQISETDSLKLENENLKRDLKTREEKFAGLEKTLAEKDSEITAINKSMDEARKVIVETAADLSQAVAAYRELAGQSNPGLVAEMIKGETIGEINVSLKNAKEIVEKVKLEMGAENARVRVPAGAPQRALPDQSGLSAREKIKQGIDTHG
jgi:uncharacterized coiled-coil protein SlyX